MTFFVGFICGLAVGVLATYIFFNYVEPLTDPERGGLWLDEKSKDKNDS